MADDLTALRGAYQLAKRAAEADFGGDTTSKALLHLVELSLDFLGAECVQVPLISLVAGKQYVSYARKQHAATISRPVNVALFDPGAAATVAGWQSCMSGEMPASDLSVAFYTAALAPCLAMELFDRQNKKGPATYFELLIGHVFSRVFGVNPQRKAAFAVQGMTIKMTMDFIFHLPSGGLRIHLPVKMSTRERVVQAWAHQRMLDTAHGVGCYRGVMVLFSETKLGLKTREVIEICVPGQWLAYQALLSRMSRVYYFDVPTVYQDLTTKHADLIQIKQFGEFFAEAGEAGSW